jgi:hypothetical protein
LQLGGKAFALLYVARKILLDTETCIAPKYKANLEESNKAVSCSGYCKSSIILSKIMQTTVPGRFS